MRVFLFSGFSKKRDSTARPDLEHPAKVVDVTLKPREGVSYLNPSIEITSDTYPAYNYAYIPDLGRCYFAHVSSQHNRNFYTIDFEIDALATAKDYIANYTCYIERSASNYDKLISDGVLSVKEGVVNVVSQELNVFNNHTPTYLFRMVGRGSTGVGTYVTTNLADIGQIFNPIFDDMSIFDIDDWIQAFVGDPAKYLLAAYISPIPYSKYTGLTAAPDNVYCGFFDTGVLLRKIKNDTVIYYDGVNIGIPNGIYAADDFRRYDSAYSQYTLYIPAIGCINIEPQLTKKDLALRWSVDVSTGEIIYELLCDMDVVATYSGNCYATLQLGQTAAPEVGNILMTAGSTAKDIMKHDYVSAAAKSIEVSRDMMAPQPSVVGSTSGVASALKFPNAIITVAQRESAEFPTAQFGRPCCKNLRIGNLSGFVKCGAPSIALPMESAITDEVNAYLANGFYFE